MSRIPPNGEATGKGPRRCRPTWLWMAGATVALGGFVGLQLALAEDEPPKPSEPTAAKETPVAPVAENNTPGENAPGQSRPRPPALRIDVDRPTPEMQAAIDKGLAWLAAQQAPDGSFGAGSQYGRHVGITALAALAFVSDGNLPGRGRYARVVDNSLKFTLDATAQQSGLIAAETSYGPMYGHGFATLFLAEMHGASTRPDLRERLRKAVALIVQTQNNQGGWRYHPVRADADLSVTVCQIMALRAARNVGIDVPKSTIDRATRYVLESQNADGGFRYMLDSSGSMFARSAAGVAALYYAGLQDDPAVARGLGYLERYMPGQTQEQTHYFYGHYYAAQAMYLAGGDHWQRWWPAIRDELIAKQTANGSWPGQAGDEYGTAMALIILQIPTRTLPILQQ